MATVKISWSSVNNGSVEFYRIVRSTSTTTKKWDVGFDTNEFIDTNVDDGRYVYIVYGIVQDQTVTVSAGLSVVVDCSTEEQEIDVECDLGFVKEQSNRPLAVALDGDLNSFWALREDLNPFKVDVMGDVVWARPFSPYNFPIDVRLYGEDVYWMTINRENDYGRIEGNSVSIPTSRLRSTTIAQSRGFLPVGMDVSADGVYMLGVNSSGEEILFRFANTPSSFHYLGFVQIPAITNSDLPVERLGLLVKDGFVYIGGDMGAVYKVDVRFQTNSTTPVHPKPISNAFTHIIHSHYAFVVAVRNDNTVVVLDGSDDIVSEFSVEERVIGITSLPDERVLMLTAQGNLVAYDIFGNRAFRQSIGQPIDCIWGALDSSGWVIAFGAGHHIEVKDIRCLGY